MTLSTMFNQNVNKDIQKDQIPLLTSPENSNIPEKVLSIIIYRS